MGEIFRYQWHDPHPAGLPDDWWLALGGDERGQWWLEATLVGRVGLRGGASRAAAFASWLLAARPEGPYETEFLLVDEEPGAAPAVAWLPSGALEPVRIEHTTLTVEVLLGREDAGGPEYLIVEPMGFAPEQGFAFLVCERLHCEPLDRGRLERAAAALLAAAS